MARMRFVVLAIVFCVGCLATAPAGGQSGDRPRARDLGIAPGVFSPGPLNAITDVAGVRVGHTTLVEGERIRTGVTAILPHGGNLFREKVAGAVFAGNAFGKLAGSTQVQELGTIETPIVLTNTLAVGTAVEAVVAWTNTYAGKARVFATTLGHNNETVGDGRYLDLLARGLLWSVGKLDDAHLRPARRVMLDPAGR